MTASRRATCLLLLICTFGASHSETTYFVKMKTNASDLFKTKNDNLRVLRDPIAVTRSPLTEQENLGDRDNDERMIRDMLNSEYDRRNSFETSTFNPDVLNKFLEEYANKIRGTTDKDFKLPYRIERPSPDPLILQINDVTTDATTATLEEDKSTIEPVNSTVSEEDRVTEILNDTLKRNNHYGTASYDDRNGWVTLDAIPWSKSKISKWQANPSTQRPWPEIKPWDKPSITKPWPSDYSSRPTYENNKPWYDKPKPYWSESSNSNEKPWQKPSQPSRPPSPAYYQDKYEQIPSQAHKWTSDKPWDKYPDLHHPSDIITDDRPSNFPSNWNRPSSSRPSYQYIDRYPENNHAEENANEWPSFPPRPEDRPRPMVANDRPHFSHYQYTNSHPPTHPSSGDGQWVLLSTNRGYSKSRQRSIKLDKLNTDMVKLLNGSKAKNDKREEADPTVPMVTSRRQVRLTVLPSINGTNTTTSHGGLLEVEKTFKSVEQSRKEYENERSTTLPTILKKRPIRNTLNGAHSSSSAVLAAVGAGMLPATMAMMIPMMLGRKRRDLWWKEDTSRNLKNFETRLTNFPRQYKVQDS